MKRWRPLGIALALSVAVHLALLCWLGRLWTPWPALVRHDAPLRYAVVTLVKAPPPNLPRHRATPLAPSPHPRLAHSLTVRRVRIAARPAPKAVPRRTILPRLAARPPERLAPKPVVAPPAPKVVASVAPSPVQIPTPPASPTPSPDPDSETGTAAGAGAPSGIGVDSSAGTGGNGTGDGAPYWPFGVGPADGGGDGPRHIVYVLDVSASMTSRIERARAELRHAIATLQPGETFDVLSFCRDVRGVSDDLVPATSTSIAEAKSYLDDVELGPGTNLEAAMQRALSMEGVNVVVLVTDGVPTVGETNFKKLAAKIRRWNTAGARIYTVGLVGKNPDGTDDSFEASKLLETISHDSGGESEIYPLGVATPD